MTPENIHHLKNEMLQLITHHVVERDLNFAGVMTALLGLEAELLNCAFPKGVKFLPKYLERRNSSLIEIMKTRGFE